jgi:hypothetical protein
MRYRGTLSNVTFVRHGPEEPYHIITTCEAIHTLHNKHLGASIIRDLASDWQMTGIIGLVNEPKIKALEQQDT